MRLAAADYEFGTAGQCTSLSECFNILRADGISYMVELQAFIRQQQLGDQSDQQHGQRPQNGQRRHRQMLKELRTQKRLRREQQQQKRRQRKHYSNSNTGDGWDKGCLRHIRVHRSHVDALNTERVRSAFTCSTSLGMIGCHHSSLSLRFLWDDRGIWTAATTVVMRTYVAASDFPRSGIRGTESS